MPGRQRSFSPLVDRLGSRRPWPRSPARRPPTRRRSAGRSGRSSASVADLGHDDLDLVGLGLLGEDRAEGLGVGVGQAPGRDVGAVVGVAAQVGVADAGDAQVLELVVLADGGEGDAVVDLGDLVQGPRGVLGDERDAACRSRGRRRTGRGRCPCARSRPGPSSAARARRRTACCHRAPPGLSLAGGDDLLDHARASSSSGTNRSALGVDDGHGRPDPAAEVRAAGGGVVVGGVVQRLDRDPDRLRRRPGPGATASSAHPRANSEPEPDAVVVVLLVAAAGDVVGEDPAHVAASRS